MRTADQLKLLQNEVLLLTTRFDEHVKDENMMHAALLRVEEALKTEITKTDEMYDAFMPMKAGLTVIATIGKVTKVVFWPLMLLGALITYLKTGHFQLPSP